MRHGGFAFIRLFRYTQLLTDTHDCLWGVWGYRDMVRKKSKSVNHIWGSLGLFLVWGWGQEFEFKATLTAILSVTINNTNHIYCVSFYFLKRNKNGKTRRHKSHNAKQHKLSNRKRETKINKWMIIAFFFFCSLIVNNITFANQSYYSSGIYRHSI